MGQASAVGVVSPFTQKLDRLGDEKSALFFLISDTDTTYNFLVALAFSQMFNLLCERADNTYGGRLPHHVRVLWDEAANTGQVPGPVSYTHLDVYKRQPASICAIGEAEFN